MYMKAKQKILKNQVSRRNFLKTSALSSAALAYGLNHVYASGSDDIRIGLIGCGGRGTGAIRDCVSSSPGIRVTALGDLFRDQAEICLKNLKEGEQNQWNNKPPLGPALAVSKDSIFTGFDAYQKVINTDVDMVILASPPHFRSLHLQAAIDAGKHVFMEKPVAVDPQGVKRVMAAADLAKEKGLSIVAGTQRRHQNHYIEIMKRIHDGQIGEIRAAQCYWIGGPPWWTKATDLWNKKQEMGWTESEYQLRNWLHFTWLSGDHIVEQHVHNLDVINWALGMNPIQAIGLGGRQVRTGQPYGNIWDHFAVQYEYPNGVQVTSMCRQTQGCTDVVAERVIGTEGVAYTDSTTGFIEGPNAYHYDADSPNPYVQEHADLISSIRNGNVLNEGRQVAESTLTAILGRMSAYTGRAIKTNWVLNASKLDYRLDKYEFGDLMTDPVAQPGITELI
jgi:myo-inositol 2-dehydrogenase/D-chiro-inositol 1-dehydrogenase